MEILLERVPPIERTLLNTCHKHILFDRLDISPLRVYLTSINIPRLYILSAYAYVKGPHAVVSQLWNVIGPSYSGMRLIYMAIINSQTCEHRFAESPRAHWSTSYSLVDWTPQERPPSIYTQAPC